MVRSLLAHKNKIFHIRVITRDPGTEKAKAIASLGAELVKADGLKLDEMTNALVGSWGLFVNTNSDDEVWWL